MSDVRSFPYGLAWEERTVRSVANLTRRDGEAFMKTAARVPIEIIVTPFPIEQATEALSSLLSGVIEGGCGAGDLGE